jgi:hypothetical protein
VAFVRWRGNSAELLTTVYDQGRSRQVRLAGLGGAYHVAPEVRSQVASRFPNIRVDWEAVDMALVLGPPAEQAARVASGEPNDRQDWLELERRLRYWAAMTEPLRRWEAERLRQAAAVLREWREAKPYFPRPEPAPGWDLGLDPPAQQPVAQTRGDI